MRLKRILNSVNYQNLTISVAIRFNNGERPARYALGVLYALKGKPSRGECDFANCLTLVDIPTKNRFEVFMDKVLTDEAVALLASDMKDFLLDDVTKIANRIATVYGEPARERVVSALIANVHAQA